MPEVQWSITAIGLFFLMLGFCLAAIMAHDYERHRRWPIYGVAALGCAVFVVLLATIWPPIVRAG